MIHQVYSMGGRDWNVKPETSRLSFFC